MTEKEIKVSVASPLFNRTECPSCFLIDRIPCAEHEYRSEAIRVECNWCRERSKIYPLSDRKRLARIMEHIESTSVVRGHDIMKLIYNVCLPEEDAD